VKLASKLLDYVIWAALAASVVVLIHHRSSGPVEGTRAAQVNLPLLGASGRFDLESHRGKPVVMEIFASWCGTCRRATPILAEMYKAHGRSDVTFVGVSLDDSPEEAVRVRDEWQIPYPVALDDGTVSRGYHVSLLPTVVLIDRAGNVRSSIAGVPSRREIERFVAER